MATTLTAGSSPAKNIFMYRNGDTNFQCKRIVINPRQIKNWNSFIELITSSVKAKNGGAVRRVFTPTGRTKVTELTNIENNHFYVAAGSEGFQRHEYNKISGLTPPKTRFKLPPIIKPVQHSRLKVSARCSRAANAVGSKVIYVFRNGDEHSLAVRVLFKKFMLKSYDVVLEEVTKKVNMTGAVWKLHSLDGRQLNGPEDFEDSECYVACGRESFKRVPYPKDAISPRGARAPPAPRRRTTRRSKEFKPAIPAQTQSEQQQQPSPKTQKPPRPAKKPTPPKTTPPKPTPPKTTKKTATKSEEQKEAEEVFHSKPTMVKRSRERDHKEDSLDFSDDPEGVFKAKEERDETKDATEVQETQETAVDLPIDQVVAEEVDEEDIKEETGAQEAEPEREATPIPEPVREATPTPEPPQLEPNEDEPAGFYSKRTPVTSKQSPILAAAMEQSSPPSPTRSIGRAQSPNENNSNSAVIRDAPSQSGGDHVVDSGEGAAKVESTPPPPSDSHGRAHSPSMNKEGDDQVIESSFSPRPPAEERGVTRTPSASNRRTKTPKSSGSHSALSRDIPSQGRESQVRDHGESPHPPPKEASAPISPTASNRRTQTPKESSSPRPGSKGGQVNDAPVSPVEEPRALSPIRSNERSQSPAENQSPTPAQPSPTASNGRAQSPTENNSPSAMSQEDPLLSGVGNQPTDDVTNDNIAIQALGDAQDEEQAFPQKDLENGGIAEPLEGEVAA